MMQFSTKIDIPTSNEPISHAHKLMLLGSCFVENIGDKLASNKFCIDVNPFGILYNPLSIKSALMDLLHKKVFTEKDLFENNGVFNSFSHHSRFSSIDSDEVLNRINKRVACSSDFLRQANQLIVTFGTAYVYYQKENGEVVSNCHKLPDKYFERKRITVEEIVAQWRDLLVMLRDVNPHLQILFTVSPIRHWKDGAHQNQLSKSTLLLAIDQLMRECDFCKYFPAYEIVLDELRDYRFYAEDMIHPSNQAVEYVWERFLESQLSKESQSLLKEWQIVRKSLLHRPLNPKSKEYICFLRQLLSKLVYLSEKNPYFVLTIELDELRAKIKSLEAL